MRFVIVEPGQAIAFLNTQRVYRPRDVWRLGGSIFFVHQTGGFYIPGESQNQGFQ